MKSKNVGIPKEALKAPVAALVCPELRGRHANATAYTGHQLASAACRVGWQLASREDRRTTRMGTAYERRGALFRYVCRERSEFERRLAAVPTPDAEAREPLAHRVETIRRAFGRQRTVQIGQCGRHRDGRRLVRLLAPGFLRVETAAECHENSAAVRTSRGRRERRSLRDTCATEQVAAERLCGLIEQSAAQRADELRIDSRWPHHKTQIVTHSRTLERTLLLYLELFERVLFKQVIKKRLNECRNYLENSELKAGS